MQRLTETIKKRLQTRSFCTIFESELSRVWPPDDKERAKRHARIQAFAKARGWEATILDPGIRVTFRKDKEAKRKKSSG